jgi:PAS domain S-box-containing protein
MNASDSRPAHASTAERRTILDAIPAIAWCKFADGSNEFVNQRWQDYTGIPADEARGQGWQAAVHPEDFPKLSEKWAEIVASGKSGEFEGRLRRHDGAFRWFLARFEPVRDDTGEIVRWYGTSTDIDALKQAEEKLREDERALRRITDTIPHRLRPSPLCQAAHWPQIWLSVRRRSSRPRCARRTVSSAARPVLRQSLVSPDRPSNQR